MTNVVATSRPAVVTYSFLNGVQIEILSQTTHVYARDNTFVLIPLGFKKTECVFVSRVIAHFPGAPSESGRKPPPELGIMRVVFGGNPSRP
ncbi:hypothetical protein CEXT_4041 [Caerostris extrusa]|uniref:Uncharacterized protein n=1 Tax=Caerostris extrusa TaxID=172846 RepID=A0AAV4QUM5_CAEEX|nr:hypothetical protein CEXT_4041 [Caerostris extrusa]